MRRIRAAAAVLILTGLSACSTPVGEWWTSVGDAGAAVARHLQCTGMTLGRMTAGMIESGLDGAGRDAGVGSHVWGGREGFETGLVLIAGGAAVGGTLGAGAGLGQGVLDIPDTFSSCLAPGGTVAPDDIG